MSAFPGWALRAALAALALLTSAQRASGQGTCEVNNQTSCIFGGDVIHQITVTVNTVIRLAIPSATVTLSTPDAGSMTSGFGTGVLVPISIRANTSWTVSLSGGTATWIGIGVNARTDKPVADLQWANLLGGPYFDASVAGAAVGNAAASSTGSVSLYLRVRYDWQLDGPGSYSLPVQLTIVAP